MDRKHNFNPGPAALPLEVLEEGQRHFVDFAGEGMSLLEMSHRSGTVERLNAEAQQLLLELLGLGKGWRVLFMGGGASLQFALVPMNLLHSGKRALYALSGSFAEKAFAEARTIGEAVAAASAKDHGWRQLPPLEELERLAADGQAAYVHMTTNNTIEGSRFERFPDTGQVPLIGDMTSDLLSRQVELSRFSLVYAGAQKNLGPAGVTVVLAREELLAAGANHIPAIMQYRTYADHQSLYNTPPVHAIYMLKLVLEWTKREGGVQEMERRNLAKAAELYAAIDESGGFYEGIVAKPDRSLVNVTWRLRDAALEQRFVQEAERNGFAGLAGHRSVGGLRASAYNAVPLAACRALADFMREFQRREG